MFDLRGGETMPDLAGATLENAIANLDQFIEEIPLDVVIDYHRLPAGDIAGRFAFGLTTEDEKIVYIQMPGWELDRVKYDGGQTDKSYPGVIVNGTGYLWLFATSITGQILAGVRDS